MRASGDSLRRPGRFVRFVRKGEGTVGLEPLSVVRYSRRQTNPLTRKGGPSSIKANVGPPLSKVIWSRPKLMSAREGWDFHQTVHKYCKIRSNRVQGGRNCGRLAGIRPLGYQLSWRSFPSEGFYDGRYRPVFSCSFLLRQTVPKGVSGSFLLLTFVVAATLHALGHGLTAVVAGFLGRAARHRFSAHFSNI